MDSALVETDRAAKFSETGIFLACGKGIQNGHGPVQDLHALGRGGRLTSWHIYPYIGILPPCQDHIPFPFRPTLYARCPPAAPASGPEVSESFATPCPRISRPPVRRLSQRV